MFATTARYALVLAFALGTIHFNGASARAEKCSTAAADDIETSLSWRFFSDALPDSVGTIPTKTISGGASFVRFSVRSWFMETSGSALSYSARSLHTAVAIVDDEMCGSMLKINAVSAGSATIRVTASANGMSATQTMSVTVANDATFVTSTSTNSAPVAVGTIAAKAFTQVTSPIRFVVSPYFSDPDGDDLFYTPSLSPTGMVEASITDSTLTLTARMKGTATVTVTARDPGGLEVTQSFRATIANSAPVPEGTIADTTFTCKTSPVSFVVSPYFSDPDPKDDLTYTPSVSSTGVVEASITDSTLTLTAVSKGSATVTVTATDPRLAIFTAHTA